MNNLKLEILIPATLLVVGILALAAWNMPGNTPVALEKRAPGMDGRKERQNVLNPTARPPPADVFFRGSGKPALDLPGEWLRFRGKNFDGISHEKTKLARSWPEKGPKKLWSLAVGEGYAGPIIWQGRVYLIDYDVKQQMDSLRCVSLADGQEIWRYSYAVRIKRSHGISRTVPATDGKIVVAIGPKCHVTALAAKSGKLLWKIDLVKEYGSEIPGWYAGQCPIIDDGKVILAPSGPDVLMMAVDGQTGEVLWTTPNTAQGVMTHTSIMPMLLGGIKTYIYSGTGDTLAVSAADGNVIWQTSEWKIPQSIYIAAPVVLPDNRIFLSGGYGAGSMMMRIEKTGSGYAAKKLFTLKPKVFGATQQTPIFYQGHLYGVRPNKEMVCLEPTGKILWQSGTDITFGIGAFMIADGLLYAVDDHGLLRMIEARPDKFNLLGEAKVLNGKDAWGPMAIAGGRFLVRDMYTLICLDMKAQP